MELSIDAPAYGPIGAVFGASRIFDRQLGFLEESLKLHIGYIHNS